METTLYFTVKTACAVYVLWHLWAFIFGGRMYGIWEHFFRLMRIVRIRLWKCRRKRMEQAGRNACGKSRHKIPETGTGISRGKPEADTPSSSPADDDVIGKTKIVYLEDPNTKKAVPVRSEPMEKVPIEEDGDISSDDVEQENKGLTAEDREELMAPVDAEPDPDFSTALTFEEINNVAEVLVSDTLDEQKGRSYSLFLLTNCAIRKRYPGCSTNTWTNPAGRLPSGNRHPGEKRLSILTNMPESSF